MAGSGYHFNMENPDLARRRTLRRNMTDTETFFWPKVRNCQLAGFKFRRKVQIGQYFPDFLCVERKLVVEVDGGQHAENAAYDGERTRWLESMGYRVVSFWDHDILTDWETIELELHRLLTAV